METREFTSRAGVDRERSERRERPGFTPGRDAHRERSERGRNPMDRLTLWLHLTSLAAYFGATLAFVLVMLPAVERIESHEERLRVLAAMLQRLNPLLIGVLGVLVMTGAFSLTAYKARLRGEFFTRIGEPLTLKLVLAFFFINGVTYVAFGLAHRIVRAVEWGDPVPPERLASMVRRMRAGSIVNLVLAGWIVWVALAIPAGAAAP